MRPLAPDTTPLWVIRLGFPAMFRRMQDIIQQLGASGLIGAPSIAEFGADSAELANEYLQSVNSSAIDRAKLCRLAYDVSVSAFAGRQQLYERFYTGDPVRLAGMLVNSYPGKASAEDRVAELLQRIPQTASFG
jgi:4-hydroxyphenylacetate 3-monooxygenase